MRVANDKYEACKTRKGELEQQLRVANEHHKNQLRVANVEHEEEFRIVNDDHKEQLRVVNEHHKDQLRAANVEHEACKTRKRELEKQLRVANDKHKACKAKANHDIMCKNKELLAKAEELEDSKLALEMKGGSFIRQLNAKGQSCRDLEKQNFHLNRRFRAVQLLVERQAQELLTKTPPPTRKRGTTSNPNDERSKTTPSLKRLRANQDSERTPSAPNAHQGRDRNSDLLACENATSVPEPTSSEPPSASTPDAHRGPAQSSQPPVTTTSVPEPTLSEPPPNEPVRVAATQFELDRLTVEDIAVPSTITDDEVRYIQQLVHSKQVFKFFTASGIRSKSCSPLGGIAIGCIRLRFDKKSKLGFLKTAEDKDDRLHACNFCHAKGYRCLTLAWSESLGQMSVRIRAPRP